VANPSAQDDAAALALRTESASASPHPRSPPPSSQRLPRTPPRPRPRSPSRPRTPSSPTPIHNVHFRTHLKSLAQKRGLDEAQGSGRRRPGQTVECGWCGRAVDVPARGRVPSWCSSSCRHRVWESRRADREQLANVRVVTRTIEVEKPTMRTVEVPVPTEPRTADEWEALLQAFATRLAQGRIYRRDLPTLEPAVRRLVEVWNRTLQQPH